MFHTWLRFVSCTEHNMELVIDICFGRLISIHVSLVIQLSACRNMMNCGIRIRFEGLFVYTYLVMLLSGGREEGVWLGHLLLRIHVQIDE